MTLTGLCLGLIILISTLIFMKGVNTMGETPRILQASAGHTIEVIGGHLISNKFFNLVATLMTSEDYFGIYPINIIVFSEDKPEDKYGSWEHEAGRITINLQKHFEGACKDIQKEEDINAKYLSLRAAIWYGMMVTLLHECFHAVSWHSSPSECKAAMTDEVRRKAIEEDCNSAAQDTSFELFRDIDCEPATISEEPFFSMRFMKFFINNIKDGTADWAVRQSIMIDSNLSYYDEEDTDGLATMREWLRVCASGDPNFEDERWSAKPKEIPNAMINPAVMIAGVAETKEVQVAEEAQVPAVVPVQSAEAEKAVFNTPVPAAGDFAQAADDIVIAEAMNTALDNAQTIDMEDNSSPLHDEMDGYVEAELLATEGRKPAAAPKSLEAGIVAPWAPQDEADLSAHLDKRTAEATCASCNHVNPDDAKFCNGCGKPMDDTKTACAFGENLNLGPFGQTQTAQPQTVPQPAAQTEFITPTTQPGAQTQQRYTQSLRNDLPNINMDVANMKRILETVYYRMHEHCFTKCGFQVCGGATGSAVGWNPAFAGNILEAINIADIPGAAQLITAIDKYNSQTGKVMMKVPITDGTISGKITKKDQLPSYAIYINNNGIECKRIFMVQNPFKTSAAGYSSGAIKAQNGNQITWVWDGADQLATGGRRWIYKIENGVAEWL